MALGNVYLLSHHGITWSFNREELLEDSLEFRESEYLKDKTFEKSVLA